MATSIWFDAGFTAFVLAMLALDLGVFHRNAHVVRTKEAGTWVAIWIALSLLFAALLLFSKGADTALLFVTGYLIELSLSVDNIFVIVMIFSYFAIPGKYQHRVLFWGILGALVMRGVFIGMGAWLVQKIHLIMYIFGAFLIFTGVKMAVRQDEVFDAERNIVMRTARRFLRVTDRKSTRLNSSHLVISYAVFCLKKKKKYKSRSKKTKRERCRRTRSSSRTTWSKQVASVFASPCSI